MVAKWKIAPYYCLLYYPGAGAAAGEGAGAGVRKVNKWKIAPLSALSITPMQKEVQT